MTSNEEVGRASNDLSMIVAQINGMVKRPLTFSK